LAINKFTPREVTLPLGCFVIKKGTTIMSFPYNYFLEVKILLRSIVTNIITPITINIAIIPESIYLRLATKASGLNCEKMLFANIKLLNIIYLLHKEVKD
jgi:hypothetical protein